MVYLHMRRLVGPHRDLDDLVQKGLIATYDALPRFRQEAKLSTFVRAICHRVWMKHLRWSNRWFRRFVLSRDGHVPEEAMCHGLASDRLLERERLRHLYDGLEKVTEKRRAVVILHDLEGMELEEIAEIVQAPVATVRTRLRDGRVALRKILENDPYFANAEAPK